MKYLVLGPGAMGFFSLLGHVSSLDLSELKEISGSSAGSILGLLLCLGMSPTEILDITLTIDIEKIYKSINIKSLLTSFSLIDHETIREALLQATYGKDPTFSQLEKTLYVSAFCLNTLKTTYFSKHTHPDMKVLDAVCMSIAIPFVFPAVKYKGFTYIDGGSEEKLPMNPFIDKKPDDVYSIEIKNDSKKVHTEINNIKDFCISILGMILNNRYTCNTQTKKVIELPNEKAFNFNMTQDEKLELFSWGFL